MGRCAVFGLSGEVVKSGGAEELISGDAAGENDGLDIGVEFEGLVDFFEEDVDGGLFERGGDVGFLLG